jgi:RNA polymerase sigma-70 factor (ECF subfamily)
MGHRDSPEGTDSQQIEASLLQPHAFAALFHRHAGSVHRYLVKRVGPQDAEDLVGETFATAFRSRTSYDLSRPDARPWLFGIATNLAHHYWRSEGRRKTRDVATARGAIAEDLSEEATSTAFFSSQEELIAQALARLDDRHLDVLLLVAGPGLTYEEVSLALGIPVGTVRSRLFRARHQLRELLGGSRQYLEGEPLTERASIATEGTQ